MFFFPDHSTNLIRQFSRKNIRDFFVILIVNLIALYIHVQSYLCIPLLVIILDSWYQTLQTNKYYAFICDALTKTILWEYSCEIIQQQGYKTWCQSTNTHTFKKTKNIHSQLLFSAVNKIVVFLSPLCHDAVMTHQANITVVEKYDITVVWILHCLTYILRSMLFIKAKFVSKRW